MAPSAHLRWRGATGTRALPGGFSTALVRRRCCDPALFPAEGNRTCNQILAVEGMGRCRMSQESGSGKYEQLLLRCKNLAPVPTAVAHPCEASALAGAVEAAAKGLIVP